MCLWLGVSPQESLGKPAYVSSSIQLRRSANPPGLKTDLVLPVVYNGRVASNRRAGVVSLRRRCSRRQKIEHFVRCIVWISHNRAVLVANDSPFRRQLRQSYRSGTSRSESVAWRRATPGFAITLTSSINTSPDWSIPNKNSFQTAGWASVGRGRECDAVRVPCSLVPLIAGGPSFGLGVVGVWVDAVPS